MKVIFPTKISKNEGGYPMRHEELIKLFSDCEWQYKNRIYNCAKALGVIVKTDKDYAFLPYTEKWLRKLGIMEGSARKHSIMEMSKPVCNPLWMVHIEGLPGYENEKILIPEPDEFLQINAYENIIAKALNKGNSEYTRRYDELFQALGLAINPDSLRLKML